MSWSTDCPFYLVFADIIFWPSRELGREEILGANLSRLLAKKTQQLRLRGDELAVKHSIILLFYICIVYIILLFYFLWELLLKNYEKYPFKAQICSVENKS